MGNKPWSSRSPIPGLKNKNKKKKPSWASRYVLPMKPDERLTVVQPQTAPHRVTQKGGLVLVWASILSNCVTLGKPKITFLYMKYMKHNFLSAVREKLFLKILVINSMSTNPCTQQQIFSVCVLLGEI